MRRARPSTTAVLPTPASPVRIGLFCRRRVSTSTIRRISESRPSTGSSLPSRARWVRLMQYWSRFGVRLGLPPAGALPGVPASPPSAPPASPSARASRASLEASVSAWKFLVRVSRLIFSSERALTLTSRRSSLSASSATSRCPLRTFASPNSIEAQPQPDSNSLGIIADSAGVRWLPVLKPSSDLPSSRSSASGAISNWRRMRWMSLFSTSSNLTSRCSTSTS
jgi:hypothetical protein